MTWLGPTLSRSRKGQKVVFTPAAGETASSFTAKSDERNVTFNTKSLCSLCTGRVFLCLISFCVLAASCLRKAIQGSEKGVLSVEAALPAILIAALFTEKTLSTLLLFRNEVVSFMAAKLTFVMAVGWCSGSRMRRGGFASG